MTNRIISETEQPFIACTSLQVQESVVSNNDLGLVEGGLRGYDFILGYIGGKILDAFFDYLAEQSEEWDYYDVPAPGTSPLGYDVDNMGRIMYH